MYYTVCYFTAIFYAVVRQISKLFINNKDSVFIFLILPPALLAVWRGSFKFYCGNTFEPATSFDHESGALTTELFPLPACVVDSGWDFDLWFDAKCFTLLKGGPNRRRKLARKHRRWANIFICRSRLAVLSMPQYKRSCAFDVVVVLLVSCWFCCCCCCCCCCLRDCVLQDECGRILQYFL